MQLTHMTLTVDATVGPVGAAPLLRCPVALYVNDVETVHVQPLALQLTPNGSDKHSKIRDNA